MSWIATLERFADILESADEALLASKWREFVAGVQLKAQAPPYHIARLLAEIQSHFGDKPCSEVRILDHGCGPASTLIWLAANGYPNVWGVDVGGDLDRQNRWARVVLGAKEQRFHVYDGQQLPYPDASFDVIISQQVLEHVPDEQFVGYYSEEGRVLKHGGIAFHQVPHKLVPFNSHTNRWLIHMLPQRLAERVMPMTGVDYPDHLHLRWPWRHTVMLKRYIGPARNLSAERLRNLESLPYYDGPKGIRMALGRLCRLPVVGRGVAAAAACVVLMETLTVRTRDRA